MQKDNWPMAEGGPHSRAVPGATVADAPSGNWVDRWAPAAARPYLRLARFDRPIGAWLLLFPCWWSQALAERSLGHAHPDLHLLALFFVGAFVMRGAGCVYNDIVDRDFDARVARTASRPIPSGQVSLPAAWALLIALSLIGLAVLVQFTPATILLGAASLVLVAIYPFSKRFTWWPQVVLGLTFKWGALVGWSAVTGALAPAALALYAGAVLWTIGYDTIYAHQDKADDRALGLKSSALHLADATRPWVAAFYTGAWLLWLLAGWLAGASLVFFFAMLAVAAHLGRQVVSVDIDDPANCLAHFRSNRDLGFLLTAAIVADMAWTQV
jgi:4-hydroxybenzoate polyprenyltransferase